MCVRHLCFRPQPATHRSVCGTVSISTSTRSVIPSSYSRTLEQTYAKCFHFIFIRPTTVWFSFFFITCLTLTPFKRNENHHDGVYLKAAVHFCKRTHRVSYITWCEPMIESRRSGTFLRFLSMLNGIKFRNNQLLNLPHLTHRRAVHPTRPGSGIQQRFFVSKHVPCVMWTTVTVVEKKKRLKR